MGIPFISFRVGRGDCLICNVLNYLRVFFISGCLTKITSDGTLGLAQAKRRWFCVRAIMSLKSVEHLPMVDSFMVDSISINDEIST